MDMRKNVDWKGYVAMRLRDGVKITRIMAELADITAQSPATVWNWKAGTHRPTKAAQRLLDIWWALPEEQRSIYFR